MDSLSSCLKYLQLSPQVTRKTGIVYNNLEVWVILVLWCKCKSTILLRCGLFAKASVLCVHWYSQWYLDWWPMSERHLKKNRWYCSTVTRRVTSYFTLQGTVNSLCSSSHKMTHFYSVENLYARNQILFFFRTSVFFTFWIFSPMRHKNWMKNFGLLSFPFTWELISTTLFKDMKEWKCHKTRWRVGKAEKMIWSSRFCFLGYTSYYAIFE